LTAVEHVLRTLTPQVLGILVRRHGDFARCEDAVQEALIDAADAWSRDGVPEHPLGWLTTVAGRRYVDLVRSDAARERREQALFDAVPRDALLAPPPDAEPARDDLLELLFLCCHPALTPSSQMALTLRAVAGLTTTEIAAAFLVPGKTMGQRISRAKQRLLEAGARFEPPADRERALDVVLHVLYLLFNEGYSASAGPRLRRPDLTEQAMRLTRELHDRLPDSGETAGLLALMLLTEARGAARTGPNGVLVPLAEQDRSRWDPPRRPVPGAVGDRGRAQRGGQGGGHRLAAGPRAVRRPRTPGAQLGHRAEPGRRPGRGARSACRPGRRGRTGARGPGRQPPAARRAGAPAGAGR
jgi:RNA polymerase sigma factor (sigma-70 family)